MIERALQQLRDAGSAQPKRDLVVGLSLATLAAGLVQDWLKVPGLTLAVLAGALALWRESLLIKAQARQKRILQAWPIVIESLESAAVAGMSLLESIRDLADSEQLQVSKEFGECCRQIDSGIGFDEALLKMKQSLANPASDFTIELLRATNTLGSAGYVSALQNQATVLRQNSALVGDVTAKQGWVVGTAKLAVAAPWLIVAILSFRPENAVLYASPAGSTILLLGLLASAVALRLVYRIGRISSFARVFA